MPIGLIIHAVMLAIAFAAIAYLVFVNAQKADGVLKPIGVVLAALLAAIGALVLIAHLTAPMFGGRPFGIPMGPGDVGPAAASSTPSATSAAAGGAKPTDGSQAGGDSQATDSQAGGDSGAAKP